MELYKKLILAKSSFEWLETQYKTIIDEAASQIGTSKGNKGEVYPEMIDWLNQIEVFRSAKKEDYLIEEDEYTVTISYGNVKYKFEYVYERELLFSITLSFYGKEVATHFLQE